MHVRQGLKNLFRVDIQVCQPLTCCFLPDKALGEQPLSAFQIRMLSSNEGHNCILTNTFCVS